MDQGIGSPEGAGQLCSVDELRRAVDAIGGLTVRLDADGTIADVADTDPATLGYPAVDLVGEPVTTLFPASLPDSRDWAAATAAAFRTTLLDDATSNAVLPFDAANGDIVSLSVTVIPGDDGDGTVCVAREVDRQATTGNRDSERTLLDTVADPVYVLDAADRVQRVNDAMVAYTGYDRAELLGREIADLFPSGRHDRASSRLADEESVGADTFEVSLVTADGAVVLTEAHVTVDTDADGDYTGSVGVLRDIRERKRRERDLELLKQVLTRVFRHNVRNELMVVQNYVGLLEDAVGESHGEYTEMIRSATDRLLGHSQKARLIEEVIETDALYETDLSSVVEEVVATARETYPAATIEVDVPAAVSVDAHPDIRHAVAELVENAVEHAADEPRLDLWLDSQGDAETLFIEDESGGLAEHEIEVLREGVERDLEHGSGVGLWLVRWLVEYSEAEMIVHRTEAGSLMGIRFAGERSDRADPVADVADSPVARAPTHVRETEPSRFRGDTVIGRVDPLHRLADVYDALEQTGGHAVLVTGEGGIGKTTLVEQFRDTLSDRDVAPVVAAGGCDAAVQPPYHAFRQVLGSLPGDRNLPELLDDAASLSADDPETSAQRKQALFADIADELRTLAADQPVVLVVEDMQWADAGTTDLFEYLVDEVGRWSHPVMFLGTYRTSDVGDAHPVLEIAEETANTGRGTVLELDPFDHSDVRALLEYMLDFESMPASLVDAIRDHTGGTPLFVNELGRRLAERLGPIQTGADLPETLEDVGVPDTVETVIGERLDALPDDARRVLALGAVAGHDFSFDVLRATTARPVDDLIEAIDTLVRRHVWTRSGDRVEFVHGVVREQTLARIDDADLGPLHARVAAAIETVYGDDLEDHAGRLAAHHERAGASDIAFGYYRDAADHAARTYAHETATDHYERALALASDHDVADDATLAALHADLAETLIMLGDIDATRETVREGLAVAPDGSEAACRLLDRRTRARIAQSEFDAAEASAERQRDLAASIGSRRLEARAVTSLGTAARKQGEYDSAREYYERTLDAYRDCEDRQGVSDALKNLGTVAFYTGEFERARERYERSREIKAELGDRQGQAKLLNNLGALASRQSEYGQAREYYERSREIKAEIGDRRGEMNSLSNLGTNADIRGNVEQARQYMEQALDLALAIGDRHREGQILGNLGLVAEKLGEFEQARDYYERSLELRREIGDREGLSETLNHLGAVTLKQGQFDQARDYFERSLEIRRDINDREGVTETLHFLGGTAIERREYERARDFLEEALESAREIGVPIAERTTLQRLGRLAREQGDYERAAAYFDEAGRPDEGDGSPRGRATRLLREARLALDRDDVEAARLAVDDAHEVFDDVTSPKGEANAARLRGRIAAESGDPETAREHWQTALDTFVELGATPNALKTLKQLIETCREQGDEDAARASYERARSLFADAPAALQAVHREWLDELSEEL